MSWSPAHCLALLEAVPFPWMAVDEQGTIVAVNGAMERFCVRLDPWLSCPDALVSSPLAALHPGLHLGSGRLALGVEAWSFQTVSADGVQVVLLQEVSQTTHFARFVSSAQAASSSLSSSLNHQAKEGLQTAQTLLALSSDTRERATQGRRIFEEWTGKVDEVLERTEQVNVQVGERVSLALERSQAISQSSARAIALVQAVSEQVEQMRVLAAGVDEIMLQTRMLSINARIEAARAGVHGKAFAVVANEVGALACRTELIAKRIEEVAAQALIEAPQCEEAMGQVSSYAQLGQSNAQALQQVMGEQEALIARMREGLSGAEGPRVELTKHLGTIEASAIHCAEQAELSRSGADSVRKTAHDLATLSARLDDSDRISPSDVYREVLDLNECLRAWVRVEMPGLETALGPLACLRVPGMIPKDVFGLAGALQEDLCLLIEEPLLLAPPPPGPITPAQVHDRVSSFVATLRECLERHGVDVPCSAPVRDQTPETVYGALTQLKKRVEVVSALRRASRAA